MNSYIKKINQASKYIEEKMKQKPDIAVILGSGLGKVMDEIKNKRVIDYTNIPCFPLTTVKGHKGKLVTGEINGRNIIAMKGRFHYYEGYNMNEVVFPIRVFHALGVETLIITNAAGGINKSFTPGDLMIIKDHISSFCPSPLRGKNINDFGPRFPDMSEAYNNKLIKYVHEISNDININLKEGVYAFSKGPMFETPAEIKMLGILGADAVGMSTVPEVITARHAGMEVIGISCITNMASGLTDKHLTHKEVIDITKITEKKFAGLIVGIISNLKLEK